MNRDDRLGEDTAAVVTALQNLRQGEDNINLIPLLEALGVYDEDKSLVSVLAAYNRCGELIVEAIASRASRQALHRMSRAEVPVRRLRIG
jgi:hypothetical protein